MVFENKKLNEMELRWPTHDKEMWAMVYYFKTWSHYIGFEDVIFRQTMPP
jgi:hypothetical protein